MTRPAIGIDLGGSHATIAVVRDEQILGVTRGCARFRAAASASTRCFRRGDSQAPCRIAVERRATAKAWRLDSAGSPMRALAESYRPIRNMKTRRRSTSMRGAGRNLDCALPSRTMRRMALLGERHAGAARGCDDVVMITLGTGIGGAAMIEGKLLRGKHAQAGCLGGHLPAKVGGRLCTCGAIGCLEAEASGWSLPLLAREWKGFAASKLATQEHINFRTLFELADCRRPDRGRDS